MKYPFEAKNIIDVTKAPYFADNTGKTDCTDVLCRVFDDLLAREREGVEKTKNDLLRLSNNCEKNYYLGFEARVRRGFLYVIYPEVTPPARIIYFPAGEYLVSDTVSYRAKDILNIFRSEYFYTLTRGIHIVGESRENTVIRLKDGSAGFEAGKSKPVIAYTTDERACEVERSNVSQLNTFCDLTIDCGKNNPGAVGLRFVANNAGRVENVAFKAEHSRAALELVMGTEGVFRNFDVDGFDIGVHAHSTSVCVFDDLSLNVFECGAKIKESKTIFRKSSSGKMPFFAPDCSVIDMSKFNEIEKNNHALFSGTHCFFGETENIGQLQNGSKLFRETEPYDVSIPRWDFDLDPEKCATVEEFGAVGDGETDDTAAIQRALSSGKPYIFFAGTRYVVNAPVFVPKTVKLVDFMFCDFFAGDDLKEGKYRAFFVINEDSEEPLCLENLYTFEQFCGHLRFMEHAARRELRMRDLHTQAAAMYVNTVPGSTVYFDNCVCTTGSYSMNTILARDTDDDYYTEIPYEFHGQRVLAYNSNPERADIEILNDGGDVTLYCLKTEGPGTATKTQNGGITRVYINSCAIGNAQAEFPMFSDDATSTTYVYGGSAFGVGREPEKEYRRIYEKEGQPDILRGEGNPFLFDLNLKNN